MGENYTKEKLFTQIVLTLSKRYNIMRLRIYETENTTRDDTMNRIKELRIQKGLTQKELACKASLSVSWIKSIESGTSKPSLRTLARIANVLDVSLKDL